MSDLATALQIAIRVHAGQTDKQGQPYLLHVLRVVEVVPEGAKVVAALHDVVEDSALKARDVALNVALSGDEVQALALLTRGDDESYSDYIQCLAEGEGIGGELAREVKLADLRDNLSRIPPQPPMKRLEPNTWGRDWGGLKLSYEKAIATLESASGDGRGTVHWGQG
jgi:hypothetical protein